MQITRSIVLLSLFLCSVAQAERPKIGLVLGGGGARGMAHIGVIRWLEENHIPIDSIAGTSIGGLVGGAYASGRSAAELEELVRGIDWGVVLRGNPEFTDLEFRRKEDWRAYPTAFEFGLRSGFRLPPAFNPGSETGLIFDRIALPYGELESFDELPTPFRCIAADLITGREIVLGEGHLGTALRATMAIPGVFAPVRRDGMVLADGGIVNNLPVDVLLKMGADIVIAVDVGAPPPKQEQLETLLGVMDRALDVMIRVNVDRNIRLAQVVLRPDVGGIGTLEFENVDQIADRGYEAASHAADRLRELAVSQDAWDTFQRQRAARRRPLELRPSFVEVSGARAGDQRRAMRFLGSYTGRSVEPERLEGDLRRITGWGVYDAAGYRKEVRGSRQGLGISLRQKSYGPPFLKPIFKINAGQTGEATFEVAARITLHDVWNKNNEWRSDISLGRLNLVATELYQFLGNSRWFVAPRAFAKHEDQFLFQGGERIADYGIADAGLGTDVGYNSGLGSEARIGYQWGYQKANVRTGSPALPAVEGQASALKGAWKLDRLNSAMVATGGLALRANASWHIQAPGTDSRAAQLEGRMTLARPLSALWALQLQAAGGGTFNGEVGPIQQFTLGGPTRIGALGLDERRGSHFVYTSAGLLRLLKENPGGLAEKIFAGVWYETGDAFDDAPNFFHSGTIGIISETKLGVFFIGGAAGESGNAKFYLSLGRFF